MQILRHICVVKSVRVRAGEGALGADRLADRQTSGAGSGAEGGPGDC